MMVALLTIRFADTAPDGARIYHDRDHRIAAVVGSAAVVLARYRRGYRDFDIWGSPEQAHGLFMLVRFDLDPHDVGLEETLLPAGARWVRLSEAELAEFADDDGPQAP